MKIKTSELIGKPLDWAVAKAEGYTPRYQSDFITLSPITYLSDWDTAGEYDPSTNWAQAGPIIEREYISVCAHLVGSWNAYLPNEKASLEFLRSGPTPLIAAMRCYVASKLGEELDIPEDLK